MILHIFLIAIIISDWVAVAVSPEIQVVFLSLAVLAEERLKLPGCGFMAGLNHTGFLPGSFSQPIDGVMGAEIEIAAIGV